MGSQPQTRERQEAGHLPLHRVLVVLWRYKRAKDCGGYTTVDLSANYKFENGLSLIARVNNIFDKKYEDYVGYWSQTRQYSPAIGRNYSVGFNYKF